jgi:hypothetical protein
MNVLRNSIPAAALAFAMCVSASVGGDCATTVTVTTAADTRGRNGQARFVGFSLIRLEFVLPSSA